MDDLVIVDEWNPSPVIPQTSNVMVGAGIDETDEPQIEYDLWRSHQIIRLDISRFNQKEIVLSPQILQSLSAAITELGQAKIQFGINAEFVKDGEIKTARISNPAAPMSDTFLQDGAKALSEKIIILSELGSSWQLRRILEVSFKVIKVSDISRLSGSSYIATPSELDNAKRVWLMYVMRIISALFTAFCL